VAVAIQLMEEYANNVWRVVLDASREAFHAYYGSK